jgi:uncharacterized protein YecT (DUF1311 family)
MNRKVFILVLMMIGVSLPALAANPDPIDAALDKCLNGKDASASMAGSLNCINKAADAWDKRLNQVYGDLMKTLDAPSHDLLVTAQRAWLDYRKKDETFAGGPWRESSGRTAQMTIASSRLEELKARVHTLETYDRGD